MAYELGFTPEFFRRECGDPDDYENTDRPTTLYQALVNAYTSVRARWRISTFTGVPLVVHPNNGGKPWIFPCDLWVEAHMEIAERIDTCGTLSTPVDVWLDPDGWASVDVFDARETEVSR